MKKLRMTVTVSLEEVENWEHGEACTLVAHGSCRREISPEVRTMGDDAHMEYVLKRESSMAMAHLIKNMVESSIPWPLSETIEEKVNRVKTALLSRFPDLCIFGRFSANSGGVYHIVQISKKNSDEPVDVCHPSDPLSYLTTRYPGRFVLLTDGRWVEVCQGMNYFNEVVTEVPPPIDSKKLSEVFGELGIPFEIMTYDTSPLPEPERDE